MYADGNAGVHQTFHANRRAFEKFGIIPRMLVDATIRDLSVSSQIQNGSGYLCLARPIFFTGQCIWQDFIFTTFDSTCWCTAPLPS